ncbi:hypothetical protein [Streptomyces sp. NPDC088726]
MGATGWALHIAMHREPVSGIVMAESRATAPAAGSDHPVRAGQGGGP